MRPRRPIFRRSRAAAVPQPDNTHVIEPEKVAPEQLEPEPEPAPVLTEIFQEAETHDDAVVPESVGEDTPPPAVFVSPVAEEQPEESAPADSVLAPWDAPSSDAVPEPISTLIGTESEITLESESEQKTRSRGRPRSAEVLQRDRAVFNTLADDVAMTKAEIAGVLGLEEIPVYQSLWRMQAQGHVKRTRHGRSHRWQQSSQQGPTA